MKDFKVDSEGDVTDFAKFVADKIKKAPGHKLVIKFLDEVLKGATENFQMNDVKIVQKNLTQIYNVKRLEFNQKKNAKKKKPTLKMKLKSRADDFDFADDYGGDDDFGI
mmetsp:Transcript_5401/g.8518  ORF Transcript_5401/g.8518 Transcript_5401/m.8518 type:complete len:109 (-) Transcript_5401:105-431(-)